jgi:hypothetical protein
MAELTSSLILPATHRDTNPGAPGKGAGPSWPRTSHDHLKLPSGKTIGETDNENLRSELTRLGIEESQTAGRERIIEKYAELINAVARAGADKAVAEWLQNHRS